MNTETVLYKIIKVLAAVMVMIALVLAVYVQKSSNITETKVEQDIKPEVQTEVQSSPSEVVPEQGIPTGTWQLKETTKKKYITISTDDDNEGNTNFFRLLRTYGFPYTMNVEAENMDKNLGADTTQPFSDSDAESLFPDGVTVAELGKYLHDHELGEVTQHGSSAYTLWDSSKLTGEVWTNLYSFYISNGGMKTEEDLRKAILEQKISTDGAQNASYVEDSRKIIENTLGFSVYAIAMWGGEPKVVVDGIELDLMGARYTSTYNYRKHNYKYVASGVGFLYQETKDEYSKCRNAYKVDIQPELDAIAVGDIEDFFSHYPYSDLGDEGLREMLDTIKKNVDEGTLEVVTPSQYISLGEYVENPIANISLSRENIPIGYTDKKDDYTVIACYQDGTKEDVTSEAIIDNNDVNTAIEGTYTVNAIYRGFNTELKVKVIEN